MFSHEAIGNKLDAIATKVAGVRHGIYLTNDAFDYIMEDKRVLYVEDFKADCSHNRIGRCETHHEQDCIVSRLANHHVDTDRMLLIVKTSPDMRDEIAKKCPE